jgi:RHS repeat-associated protein
VRSTINGTTTDYLYDGANVVQEQIAGTPSANLLTGGVDEVFSRMESANTQSALADGLGSTLALLNSAGETQTEYTYEPFGNTSITGAGSSNTSQYTARENDGTGLYYYRARYYSPKLQRFISEDPIGFAGNDTNLYSYVFNSPTNLVDPFGLSASSVGRCFLKGLLIGAAGAVVVAGAAVALTTLGVPAVAITIGLGAIGVVGGVAVIVNALTNISDRNWDRLAYDIGSVVGAAAVGAAGGRPIAEHVNGVRSPPWSPRSDLAQHYNPKLGSVRDWLDTGTSPGSAAGSVAAGGAGAATTVGRSCGC